MKWPRINVRMKQPNPLQKPRTSPRFRMTQLRQGKQRPKTFLPLNRARKKSLLLQLKSEASVDRIRFLVRQNLDFTQRRVSRVHGFGFLITGTIHTCSIAARAILARLLLEQDCGSSVSASSSFSSPLPSILAQLLLEQDCGSGVSTSSSFSSPIPSILA